MCYILLLWCHSVPNMGVLDVIKPAILPQMFTDCIYDFMHRYALLTGQHRIVPMHQQEAEMLVAP